MKHTETECPHCKAIKLPAADGPGRYSKDYIGRLLGKLDDRDLKTIRWIIESMLESYDRDH